jgi:type IV secretory pathway TrbD component
MRWQCFRRGCEGRRSVVGRGIVGVDGILCVIVVCDDVESWVVGAEFGVLFCWNVASSAAEEWFDKTLHNPLLTLA